MSKVGSPFLRDLTDVYGSIHCSFLRWSSSQRKYVLCTKKRGVPVNNFTKQCTESVGLLPSFRNHLPFSLVYSNSVFLSIDSRRIDEFPHTVNGVTPRLSSEGVMYVPGFPGRYHTIGQWLLLNVNLVHVYLPDRVRPGAPLQVILIDVPLDRCETPCCPEVFYL